MIGLDHIRSGASRLAATWLKEWQAVVPVNLRATSGSGRPTRFVIGLDEDQVTISLNDRNGGQAFVERCRWADYNREVLDRALRAASARTRRYDMAIVLSLPQAVSGSMTVPLQARARADAIVRDHVARKIPLKADTLFIGHEAREVAGKLELRYLILPRERLDHILARLSMDLSELDAMEGAPTEGLGQVIISCDRPQAARAYWAGRAVVALVAVVIAAPVVGFGTLAWRQSEVLKELEAQSSSLTTEARRSTEKLKDVYGMADDLDRLAKIRSASSVTEIWEELARLIPDTTYLKEVEIKGADVHTSGFSDAASDLISRFESSPLLSGAALTGPVVLDRAIGKEHFTLRTSVRKPRLPEEEHK